MFWEIFLFHTIIIIWITFYNFYLIKFLLTANQILISMI